MKNKTSIITIILITIGILIMGLSLAMVKFDFRNFVKVNSFEEKKYEIEAIKIDKIVIRGVDRNVKVENSNDDKIHITYYDNEKIKEIYQIKLDNKTLNIKTKLNIFNFQLNPLEFFPQKNVDIIIQIPESMQQNIVIEKI